MRDRVQFGTDGIRGRAGVHPCTVGVAAQVGRAAVRLARAVGGVGRVLIARDTRPSGVRLEAALVDGITSAGGTAVRVGVLPTSGLAAALAAWLGDAGVMLTASHNPAEDNGFKLLGHRGLKLTDAENACVEDWIAEPESPSGSLGTVVDAGEEALQAYVDALRRAVPVSALVGRRIAVDLAHGAGVSVREALTHLVPCEFVFIGDGDGQTNEGCGSEHPELLQQVVVARACDAGLAIDGDGDRCRLVDASGAIVNGDAVAALLAEARGVSRLAVTVMSTVALESWLPRVDVVRTAVGDRHLAEALRRGAQLGVEESGHALFDDALPTGDGLVTGLRSLDAAFSKGTLAEAVAKYRPFPRRTGKIRVAERLPLDVFEAARVALEGELSGGRVFLRYSGTEPVLRILVEGPDAERVSHVFAAIESATRVVFA